MSGETVSAFQLNLDTVSAWLRETDAARLERLFAEADRVRQANVGDDVYLRGLIEVSNICVRRCAYCGISAARHGMERYRMTADEVVECAVRGRTLGYGTVVLQAGEDEALTGAWVEAVVRRIKAETGLAVTLSLGERTDAELAAWHAAGADRYLLRFETSNSELFGRIHPPPPAGRAGRDRVAMLQRLCELRYEVGSGIMIGIPGQRYADLARDILLFRELDLDMIGVGPFIAHPATPLGRDPGAFPDAGAEQVPNTEAMTYKVVALARLACPRANIPSTTALATLNKAQGRELGLSRGANIVMPNLTPPKYRRLYELYPDKACINETAEQCHLCLSGRIASIGRRIGKGPGMSPNFSARWSGAGASDPTARPA